MRHSNTFHQLLLQYEAAPLSSGHRSKIFQKMRKVASTFSDWASIYQYAGVSIRKDAQREMEAKVLNGKTTSDVQLNILELFMVIDNGDKDAILEKYLRKHKSKDDLLFALTMCNGSGGSIMADLMAKVAKFYKRGCNITRAINARSRKSSKILEEESTFNP